MEVFNPKVPRKMLWTDLTTMDEFFKLDPVNEYFFEYYASLREGKLNVTLDAVRVFNEVYYQATRLIYDTHDDPFGFLIEEYQYDIKANLGWKFSDELVLTMIYWLLKSCAPESAVYKFYAAEFIKKVCSYCSFWTLFNKCFRKIREDGLTLNYDFRPKPANPDELRKDYILWGDFTNDYHPKVVRRIIEFWDDEDDRKQVAEMIKESLERGAVVKYYDMSTDETLSLLDGYINYRELSMAAEADPYEELDGLRERIRQLEDENAARQSRIDALEADNKRMKALMEKKKQKGAARKFTLVEIVEYCKKKPGYEFVDGIVAMLYKFLRKGTDEEQKLVDSIEEYFNNKRYGNTYVQEEYNIEHVGNFKSKIKEQTVHVPAPSLTSPEQKLIEE